MKQSKLVDLEVLKSFLPYSEGQGIRFGKPIRHPDNGAAFARYLTRYINKDSSSNNTSIRELIKWQSNAYKKLSATQVSARGERQRSS